MEEPEVPTEHLHESIHERIEEAGHKLKKKGWTLYLAVSTAIMAVLAAVSSLQAGHHSNEAMISQIASTDQWAHYQAKAIKYDIVENMLLSKTADSIKLKEKLVKYKEEEAEIFKEATESEKESKADLEIYKTLAMSVTFFQIAIAISAISMLTDKRFLWYGAIILSMVGVWQFIMGMMG